jgi:isocitrate/isopropylmalate dehydrogenase
LPAQAAATHKVAVLAGDGIGPEITDACLKVLSEAARAEGEELQYTPALIGGAAIDATGDPYPAETEAICKASDAVLLACIGGCGARGGGGGGRGIAQAEGAGRKAVACMLWMIGRSHRPAADSACQLRP